MVNMTRLTVDFKIMTLFHMNMWQTIQDTAVVSVERQQEVICAVCNAEISELRRTETAPTALY